MAEPADVYRFFMPEITPGENTLPPDQADHALRVLRLISGQRVNIFDGRGHAADGRLESVGRVAKVRIDSVSFAPAPAVRLTLACAIPKADRADQCVETLSQLNAYALQWTLYDRGVVKPAAGGNKMEKWRRLALESCKQCRRLWAMDVLPPKPLETVLADIRAADGPAAVLLVYGDPHALSRINKFIAAAGPYISSATSEHPLDITAFIGPEGGFSERERTMFDSTAGVVAVNLTATILRIETAAAAFAAIVSAAIP